MRAMPLALAIFCIYLVVALPAGLGISSQMISGGGATSPLGLAGMLLALVLIALSTIDALTFELPDVLTLPLASAGILLQLGTGWHEAAERLLAAVVAYAALAGLAYAYEAIRGQAGLGLGDAKLMAAAGAWLGIEPLPSVILLAAVAALLTVGVAWIRNPGVTLSSRLPFGPYLALGIWLVWLYGPIIAASSI